MTLINLYTKESKFEEEFESFSLNRFDVSDEKIHIFSKKVDSIFGEKIKVLPTNLGIELSGDCRKLSEFYKFFSDSDKLVIKQDPKKSQFSKKDTDCDITLLKSQKAFQKILIASNSGFQEAASFIDGYHSYTGRKRNQVEAVLDELDKKKQKLGWMLEKLQKMLPDFSKSILSISEEDYAYLIQCDSYENASALFKIIEDLLVGAFMLAPSSGKCTVRLGTDNTKKAFEALLTRVLDKPIVPEKLTINEVEII